MHLEAVGDVLPHRHVREERVLLVDDAHAALMQRDALDVLVADLDGAVVDAPVQREGARNRLKQHGLARSGPAQDCKRLAGLNLEMLDLQTERAALHMKVVDADACRHNALLPD